MTTKVAVPLFVCATLAGCVLFVPGVDDLRLVNVEPVSARDLALHDDWGNLQHNPPPADIIGKITVTTTIDIHDLGERASLNIVKELTLCGTGSVVYDWPSVYFNGVDINPNTSGSIDALYRRTAASHKEGTPYTYEIYFALRSTNKWSRGIGSPDEADPYDLTRTPQDLCLTIAGGNEFGGHFVSNTVRVPSAEIARAFSQIPPNSPVATGPESFLQTGR